MQKLATHLLTPNLLLTCQKADLTETVSEDDSKKIHVHKSCGRDYELTTYYHLPEYLRHNQYVLHHYRSDLNMRQAFCSFFHIHNESCNVWTHFFGFVLFFVLTFTSQQTWLNHDNSDYLDLIVFLIFALSAQAQMLCSTIFHWFCCVSAHMYDLTAKMDYSGIAILIVGSYFSPMYYIFYEHTHIAVFYLSCISILGALAIYSVWSSTMHHPGSEVLRLAVFIGLGFFGFVPLPHAIYLIGWKEAWSFIWRLLIMGGFYLVGAFIYGFKFPERYFPGKFDVYWQSHAIWHVFVLLGAYTHYLNVTQFHIFRKHLPTAM